jgi:hypothetical protein
VSYFTLVRNKCLRSADQSPRRWPRRFRNTLLMHEDGGASLTARPFRPRLSKTSQPLIEIEPNLIARRPMEWAAYGRVVRDCPGPRRHSRKTAGDHITQAAHNAYCPVPSVEPVVNFECSPNWPLARFLFHTSALPPPHATLASRRPATALPAPDLHRLIAPALPGAFPHSITSSARGEQRRRDFESERLGGFQIDHQLVFGRRLHRQVGRLLALEDAIDIASRAAELVDCVGSIGDQVFQCTQGALHCYDTSERATR